MARENQGLQIALIIFVMLTIILGVTTYLFFRQYQEGELKVADYEKKLADKTKLADANEKDVNDLKGIIGLKNEKVEAVVSTFNDDMKKFGAGYTEDVLAYHPLLEKMSKTVQDKNADVKDLKDKIAKLENDFKVREANKQPQIDKFKQSADEAGKDLANERSKYQAARDQLAQDEAKLKADLEEARKKAAAEHDKMVKRLDDTVIQSKKIKDNNDRLAKQLESVLSQKIDVPSGEILWANQRAGMVWINLGRADALHRKITFGVYPPNITDLASKAKKGNVEVTQIIDDHLAEARISTDSMTDPIMPGDKIYTPIWSPGEKRHFALAGFIDLDGDGKSDLQTVIDVINLNGGVVDGYIDENGKRNGEITINTRYLVLGEAPTEKGQPVQREAFVKMVSDADRLGVQKIQFEDMLDRMGWKSHATVLNFGHGGNPRDFAPKQEGMQKKSTGNVSDSFKPRQPGSSGSSSGAYYKFRM